MQSFIWDKILKSLAKEIHNVNFALNSIENFEVKLIVYVTHASNLHQTHQKC